MIDYRLLLQKQNPLRIAVGKSNHHLHHQLQEAGWKPLYALQQSSSSAELPRDTKKNLEPSEFCHPRLILLKQFLAATNANFSSATALSLLHELQD